MDNLDKEFSKSFFLTPAECNPEQVMPITLLVSRIIEVATLHANSWNVGYATLVKDNETWVLSRVTIEMDRYPTVNETYSLTTWIEGFNRHFSERNFAICDGDNNIIGYARTIWVVINSETRESADISKFTYLQEYVSDRICPIEKQLKLRKLGTFRNNKYRFKYCDVDFNRHVNSCKYIELFLNQWSLDFHDTHYISRFEISYIKEAYFGEEVDVNVNEENALDCTAELLNDNDPLCRARFKFTEKDYKLL